MADQEAIAKRAYELYLERGSVPGSELEDWLAAEAELTAAAAAEPTESASEAEMTKPPTTASGDKRGSSRRESAATNRRSLRP